MTIRTAICMLGLVFVAGCGSSLKLNPVTGKVTLDGKPITDATVTFTPSGAGAAAVGRTDANGVYTLMDNRGDGAAGAEQGEYKVAVLWYKPSGKDLSQQTGAGEEKKDDRAAHTTVQGPTAQLPTSYLNPDTSGLTASVKAGSNTFDFDLKSK